MRISHTSRSAHKPRNRGKAHGMPGVLNHEKNFSNARIFQRRDGANARKCANFFRTFRCVTHARDACPSTRGPTSTRCRTNQGTMLIANTRWQRASPRASTTASIRLRIIIANRTGRTRRPASIDNRRRRLSGRRLPAARRSRQGRASPSALPGRRSRPRRSIPRRRRPR